MMIEKKILTGEVRMAQGESDIIEGFGAIYNSWSVDMGFEEIIEQGAMRNADISDVRMLNDHLSHQILARTKSNTLKVTIDEKGLFYRGHIANTSFGRDLLVSVQRGDVDQSSFAFTLNEGDDEWEFDGGKYKRHIKIIREIKDVSPTAFPAYEHTRIDKRRFNEIKNELQKRCARDINYIDTMVRVHKILSY